MANRIPLVVDSSNYRIEELPVGDTLDLGGSTLQSVNVSGVATFSSDIVGVSSIFLTKSVNLKLTDLTYAPTISLGTTAGNPALTISSNQSTPVVWSTSVVSLSSTESNLLIGKNGADYFRVANNGNVAIGGGETGVGVTDPQQRLVVGGNLGIGYGTTENYIAFRGIYLDGIYTSGAGSSEVAPFYNLYQHAYIGERVYAPTLTQATELLIFKGNDADLTGNNTDRIRLLAPNHVFQTWAPNSMVSGSFHAVGVGNSNVVLTGVGGSITASGYQNSLEVQYNKVIVGTALSVTGALSKGSGSFRIQHPIAEDRDLVHSFVEGPQADLIYRGKVTLVDGSATVNLDERYGLIEGTWIALCRDPQVLVSNNNGWTAVKGSISESTLTITAKTSTCTDVIDWVVIAERQDDNIKSAEWTDDEGRPILEPSRL